MTDTEKGGSWYGSIGGDSIGKDSNNSDTDDFKESYLYYYKKDDLTKKEKLMKTIKLIVPIIIAIFLIGGIAWVLFQNLDKLYPAPSTNGGKTRARTTTTGTSTSSSQYDHFTNDDTSPPSIKHLKNSSTDRTSSTDTTISSSNPLSNSSTKNGVDSSCSAYQACQKLELVGECCPTIEDDILECCG